MIIPFHQIVDEEVAGDAVGTNGASRSMVPPAPCYHACTICSCIPPAPVVQAQEQFIARRYNGCAIMVRRPATFNKAIRKWCESGDIFESLVVGKQGIVQLVIAEEELASLSEDTWGSVRDGAVLDITVYGAIWNAGPQSETPSSFNASVDKRLIVTCYSHFATMSISMGDTLGSLKESVEKWMQLPVARQRLVCDGEELLDDSLLLTEYDFESKSTVEVLLGAR